MLEDGLGIADDLDIRLDHLAHLGDVDVDVDDSGLGRELGGLPDDAVVEAGTHIEKQVALAHRLVGVGGAMHPEHPESEIMRLGENALAEQGRGHGSVHLHGQFHEFALRSRDHRAVAGEDEGLFGEIDEAGGLFDRRAVDIKSLLGLVTGQVDLGVEIAGKG